MEKSDLKLSDNQIKKLARGQISQLNRDNVSGKKGSRNVKLYLTPMNKKKLDRARSHNKGCRLQLSKDEIEGSGLWDLIKKGAKAIKKGVQSDFYQKNVRDKVGDVIDAAIDLAPVPGFAQEGLKRGREWLGDRTGAFGMMESAALCPSCYGGGMVPSWDARVPYPSSAMRYAPHYYRGFGQYGSNVEPYGGSFKAIGGSFAAI